MVRQHSCLALHFLEDGSGEYNTFPVWLSVSAENPVGLGEMIEYWKYTAEIPNDRMRVHGEAGCTGSVLL